MRRGTPEFEELRAAGADVAIRADLIVGGIMEASTHHPNRERRFRIGPTPEIGFDSNGTPIELPVVHPDLDQSAAAKITTAVTTIELLADHDVLDWMVPGDMWHPFAPVNIAELHVKFGYQQDGVEEFLPAAVLHIDEIRIDDHGDGLMIEIDCYDRSQQMEDSQLWYPVAIPAGANVVELVQHFVGLVYPNLEVISPTVEAKAAAMELEEGKTLLDIVHMFAGSIGHTFHFDADGTPKLQPPPLPDTDPVLTLTPGDGLLLSACRMLTRRGVYNGAIVRAETTIDANEEGETPEPLYAEAWADHIAGHPLAYTQQEAARRAPGAFPYIETSQVLTDANSVNIATRRLADQLALQPEHVSVTMTPQPGLELFDPVQIEHPGIKVSGLFTVGTLSRPLGVGWHSAGMNQRRVI